MADPRTHITPDAFGVAPELLGFALASPTRRLVAILIDLALAAIIARTGIEYLIAAAAALFAWRAISGPADRLLAGRGRLVFQAASAALVLIVVINLWNGAAGRIHLETGKQSAAAPGKAADSGAPRDSEGDVEVALRDLGLSRGEQASFLVQFAAMEMADPEAAGERAAELGRWVREKTSPGSQRDEFSAALASAMKPELKAAFLGEVAGPATAGDATAAQRTGATADSVRAQPDSADSLRAGQLASADSSAAATVAPADSLRLLTAANRQLRDRNRELREQLDHALEEKPGGVRTWLAGVSDDLGLGFGWFALYFTAFTVLGRGQTPGKRLLGIKVLRCDNRPISWWLAFERFGAYTASFSTGLLGFAQILWDRNRQALHDKAADTVVIRLKDGQPIRMG